jgi:hypothetical protein
MSTTSVETKSKMVRAKFNFAQMNPRYDSSKALKTSKEEKSYQSYLAQRAVDYAMTDFIYEAGRVYDISEELFNKLCYRTVETYNPLFGKFQGQALELIERPNIPYVLRVDELGNLINPMDFKVDLFPKKTNIVKEENIGTVKKKKKQ